MFCIIPNEHNLPMSGTSHSLKESTTNSLNTAQYSIAVHIIEKKNLRFELFALFFYLNKINTYPRVDLVVT